MDENERVENGRLGSIGASRSARDVDQETISVAAVAEGAA
jgi:hypothetical protein